MALRRFSWERTSLVARTVFKTAEAVARRLVGSIPTRSRHNFESTRNTPQKMGACRPERRVDRKPGDREGRPGITVEGSDLYMVWC